MNAEALKSIQAPLKERYISDPSSAFVTLSTSSTLDEGISCKISTGKAAKAVAGLHPMAGGAGDQLGDMLLEALVACTGVTLRAVSTALEIHIESGTITAEGDLDFRCLNARFATTPETNLKLFVHAQSDFLQRTFFQRVKRVPAAKQGKCVVMLFVPRVRLAEGVLASNSEIRTLSYASTLSGRRENVFQSSRWRKAMWNLLVSASSQSRHDAPFVRCADQSGMSKAEGGSDAFPLLSSPTSFIFDSVSASPEQSFSPDSLKEIDAADSYPSPHSIPSPPHTFILPSLPAPTFDSLESSIPLAFESAQPDPLPSIPSSAIESFLPTPVPPLYYLADHIDANYEAPDLSRLPSALPEAEGDWPRDLWAEATGGLAFDDDYGFAKNGWEVSEVELGLEATLEEWERDHACKDKDGDDCRESCPGSGAGETFPWI
ncbi:hypothetical protein P7C70_g8377, partial [Phenoliferia sp. Uapishka_3]